MDEAEEVHSHGDTANLDDLQNLPEFGFGSVSPIYECETKDASKLHIYNIANKLSRSGEYHIGGTYANGDSEFWFYCTTSRCFDLNYLLNLFVCHRGAGRFSVGVSNSNKITHLLKYNIATNESNLSSNLNWYSFHTAEPNEKCYIKTFCFSLDDIHELGNNILVIPISIKLDPKFTLNQYVLRSIKVQHDLVGLILKQEKADFTLVSTSSKKYCAHKILLAAHSTTLRRVIANAKSNEHYVDLNDGEVEILLEFINTGTVKDVTKYDSFKLLDIADRYQVGQLFLLLERVLCTQINIENAIKIALIAKKFKLEKLQHKVYYYIKNNPQVLKTKAWETLDDVELTKDLFQTHVTRN